MGLNRIRSRRRHISDNWNSADVRGRGYEGNFHNQCCLQLRFLLKNCYGALLLSKMKHDSRELQKEQVPVYHPTPSQTRLATQLTEEEQIRIAQRIGLIQHLPKGVYDPGRDGSEKKIRECVICMMDFVYGDPIRFLPCMHIYHLDCIDDWLMRSFTCPSCMEPVDAALLSSYETN
ncbi:RING finger protein 11 isoform X1 [Pituophis catenifer annectens]